MASSGFFARRRSTPEKEPGYVRTTRDEGRKYIDPNEFIKDARVEKQIRRLSKEAGRKRVR